MTVAVAGFRGQLVDHCGGETAEQIRQLPVQAHEPIGIVAELRPVIGALLRLLLNRPKQFVLVQNPDDRNGDVARGTRVLAQFGQFSGGRVRRNGAISPCSSA